MTHFYFRKKWVCPINRGLAIQKRNNLFYFIFREKTIDAHQHRIQELRESFKEKQLVINGFPDKVFMIYFE